MLFTSEKGISLERKASPNDKPKLTIKLTNPMIPTPKIPQKSREKSREKLEPYSAKARFPLAKVIWRISKFNPKKIPTEAVEPIKIPNQKLDVIPAHLCSYQ